MEVGCYKEEINGNTFLFIGLNFIHKDKLLATLDNM